MALLTYLQRTGREAGAVTAQNRAVLYDAINDVAIELGTLVRERNAIDLGVVNKSLPTVASLNAIQTAIWGRNRTIIIEGSKRGTQAAIEAFIKTMEDWVNKKGFTNIREYYPMFHAENTSAGTEQQDGFYVVLGEGFEYKFDTEVAKGEIQYTLVLREGNAFEGLD